MDWTIAIVESITGGESCFSIRTTCWKAGLSEGQTVDLTSHFEGEERLARRFTVVPYSIPRGCAATYFPETNVLVPVRSVAEKSNTPASKSVVISIKPSVKGDDKFDHDSVVTAD